MRWVMRPSGALLPMSSITATVPLVSPDLPSERRKEEGPLVFSLPGRRWPYEGVNSLCGFVLTSFTLSFGFGLIWFVLLTVPLHSSVSAHIVSLSSQTVTLTGYLRCFPSLSSALNHFSLQICECGFWSVKSLRWIDSHFLLLQRNRWIMGWELKAWMLISHQLMLFRENPIIDCCNPTILLSSSEQLGACDRKSNPEKRNSCMYHWEINSCMYLFTTLFLLFENGAWQHSDDQWEK